MRGIKIGSVFAVCGFLLSFVSGLFSHSSFFSVLMKAFIFAIIFGLLGFVIDFVFEKFLASDTTSEFGGENGEINSSSSPSTVGNLVDITIQDEDLERSESDNHFVVNGNHQMLNESDLEQKSVDNTQNAEPDNGFVPLKNFETLKSLTGKEAVHPESTVANENLKAAGQDSQSKKDDGLDMLPDMSNISFEKNDGTPPDADDVSTDGEFVSSANMRKHNDETEIKDASLMAKAISSILSDEDS